MKTVRRLLQCGAAVNAQNKDKETPLHLALKDGRPDVARMLVVRGRIESIQDKDGRTPLHLSFQEGLLDVLRILIKRGVGLSAQDKDGQTPLYLALHLASQAQASRLNVMEVLEVPNLNMLIECGVDVSAQNKHGQTPLHLALQAMRVDVVRMLIEHDADMSAQDKDGQTPLHLALRKRQLEVAYILIERGAGMSAQNKDGQTPLHLALQAMRLDVVRMLIERDAGVSTPIASFATPGRAVWPSLSCADMFASCLISIPTMSSRLPCRCSGVWLSASCSISMRTVTNCPACCDNRYICNARCSEVRPSLSWGLMIDDGKKTEAGRQNRVHWILRAPILVKLQNWPCLEVECEQLSEFLHAERVDSQRDELKQAMCEFPVCLLDLSQGALVCLIERLR